MEVLSLQFCGSDLFFKLLIITSHIMQYQSKNLQLLFIL